jgi:hypothetical protein
MKRLALISILTAAAGLAVTSRSSRGGQFHSPRLRVGIYWGYRDGVQVIAFGRWVHAFFWTRGARRSPLYVRGGRAMEKA